MTKQRYNVSEVAELLLQEMDNFKASAKSLAQQTEELKHTTIQVDEGSMSQLRELIDYHRQMEAEANEKRKAFLDDLSHFEAKRRYRMPNGLTYALIVLFVAMMAFSAYVWNQLEELHDLKAKVEQYERKGE